MKQIFLTILFFASTLNASFLQSNSTFFSGQINVTTTHLGSKYGGKIKTILKNDGDKVKKDEAIIIFENKEQLVRQKQLQAQIEQLSAQLKKLQNGYREEEINLAKYDYEAKRSAYNYNKSIYLKNKKLFAKKAISQDSFEKSQSLYLQAQALQKAANEKLKLMQKGYRKEDIQSAEAALLSAKQSLKLLEIEIEDLTIISPTDGVIENISVESGELVAPYTKIVTLMDIKKHYAAFYVPETMLYLIKSGQKVFLVPDGEDKRYEATIYYISQSAQFTPKNISTEDERDNLLFEIRAKVTDKDLLSGMFVKVYLK